MKANWYKFEVDSMDSIAKPKVTVLMPVYNGARFLAEAMESILGQTFADFEFLIINDGSTDDSLEIIHSFQDLRINQVNNGRNMGLIYTLNRGIDLAQGEYIARMDCDDISLPKRLERQVAFMDQHPEMGVCGTWAEFVNPPGGYWFPSDHESIVAGLQFTCWLVHPSIIFRASILREHHLYYNPAYQHAEDLDLWFRMSKVTRLANVPEVLLKYRIHPDQISQKFSSEQQATAAQIRNNQEFR
jgi:glycosyltransferase involved in cell wall biosynthesis